MNHSPRAIIITGLPASGKSTLATRIAGKFSIPSLHKDSIKEILFDKIGYENGITGKQMGIATYEIVYHFFDTLMRSGVNCVLESNFTPEYANSPVQKIINRHNVKVLQILCKADGEVLYNRYKERTKSKDRHPGHEKVPNSKEHREAAERLLKSGKIDPLDIDSEIIVVDTNDFGKVDYNDIYSRVEQFLEK